MCETKSKVISPNAWSMFVGMSLCLNAAHRKMNAIENLKWLEMKEINGIWLEYILGSHRTDKIKFN